jgi:hypothetical protein
MGGDTTVGMRDRERERERELGGRGREQVEYLCGSGP